MIVGQPGTGKGALLETLSVLPRGKIIDMFGPKDGEGLCWCKHKRYRNNVLLIHGDNAKISTEYDHMPASKVKLADIAQHQTVISVAGFYQIQQHEWQAVNRISSVIWQRQCWRPDDIWSILVREGTSLLYSRIGLGGDQGTAKNEFLYAIREFRHSGCHTFIDALDFMGLDVSFRRITDMIFLKAVGIEGLPDRLRWMYKYYDLFSDLMQMPKYVFIYFSRMGAVGHGVFTRPYFHKEENEDIKKALNIEVEFEGAPQEAKGNGVGDLEHSKIIVLRMTQNSVTNKTFSIKEISRKVSRSTASVQLQIEKHNDDVAAKGECDKCAHANSELSKKLIPAHCMKEGSDALT